jgi:hypothetical protein
MFDLRKTAQELENMLHDIIVSKGMFVCTDKNVFRYKKYLVSKKDDQGWNVFYIDKHKYFVAATFLKITAFAACKIHEKNDSRKLKELLALDEEFSKAYVDSLFFKNTAKNAKDSITKDTALWRYEIAHQKAAAAKQQIDAIFYRSIV